MKNLQGTPVSKGVIKGQVWVKKPLPVIEKKACQSVEAEVLRYQQARQVGLESIRSTMAQAAHQLSEEEMGIFLAHEMLIDDFEFVSTVETYIKEEGCVAQWAVQQGVLDFEALFSTIEDPYIKGRIADLKDVAGRVIRILTQVQDNGPPPGSNGYIVVAHDLTPSETAVMDPKQILGLITEVGGYTSHTAIIARTLEIPCVVGVNQALKLLTQGQEILLNGETGSIVIDPDEAALKVYDKEREAYFKHHSLMESVIGQPAVTTDGFKVQLCVNIASDQDVDHLDVDAIDGVGLFRTEFLYMDRTSLPSEEVQFLIYKHVVEGLKGKPVVIRTLDIGGDKALDYLGFEPEDNPFLGFRAIRYCLKHTEIFKDQLRAILRASAFGKAKIMFPMITGFEELEEALQILETVKTELKIRGVSFDAEIPVGMMMETPGAAIMADLFAPMVDFFSIGTNDLIQYTLAVDRMNTQVAHLYSGYHPGVIRMIKTIVSAAKASKISVSMCGEMAADATYIPLLVGMGLDTLSMSKGSLLESRYTIRQLNQASCDKLAKEIQSLRSIKTIKGTLLNYSQSE